MKYPRFRVATVTGYTITDPYARRSGIRHPTVAAMVCDALYLWRVVKTYRAEDRVYRNGVQGSRGNEGAKADAEDHAAYLNEQWARELHTDAVRASRARARGNGGELA